MQFNAYVTDIITEDQQEHEAPMRTTITLEMTGGHSERRTLFAIMRAAMPVSVSIDGRERIAPPAPTTSIQSSGK